MPNWCSTTYVIVGKQESIADINAKLDHLASLPEPLIKNGFGKLWLGCLVNLLGGDWHEVECRGGISEYTLNDNTLTLTCETAWGELPGFRTFLKSKYPDIHIYYCAEEPGCGIYETNNSNGLYFPDRYLLDYYDGSEYFPTLQSAAAYITTLTGIKVTTEAEIEAALNDFEEQLQQANPDAFYAFRRFKVIDDEQAAQGN